MPRILPWLVVLAVVPTALAGAGEATHHSGVILAVQADRRSLTLEEMGPWTGPDRGVVKRTIVLAPDTTVTAIARSQEASPGGWAGAFRETQVGLADIKPGSFATVVVERRGTQLVARSVAVLRPTSETPGR